MFEKNIELNQLKELFLSQTPLIDVRAPVEFALGGLPGAVNLPILSDSEREQVGTIYKQKGQQEAIRLGQQLVSGKTRDERVQVWQKFIAKNPSAVIYCFRGGLRSRTAQAWLKEIAVDRPLIVGGYKRCRHFLSTVINEVSKQQTFLVVSGPTGSGKTLLLESAAQFYPTLDLEDLAKHRGSAFGAMTSPQPTQINFENQMAVELLSHEKNISEKRKLLVEDESRMIGKVVQPESFFHQLRDSEVIWLEEPLEVRVQNIFDDYILKAISDFNDIEKAQAIFTKYQNSVRAIERKLGGARATEVLQDMQKCMQEFIKTHSLESNKVWIQKLLEYYYDPLYFKSLNERNPKVFFRGTRKQAFKLLKSL